MSETQHNATPKKAPRWAKAFLTSLAELGNVRAACEAAKIERSTAYRQREDDSEFAAAWDIALENAADLLEEEARRRAHEGVRRLKFDRGKMITIPVADTEGRPMLGVDGNPIMVPYVEHEYSDALMMFLLKGIRPEKFRDRTETKHTFEPINWDAVPDDIRQAFIEGKINLADVHRLTRTA